MNEDICRHEPNVRRAAAEDKWSEALRAHIETCVDCRAAAAISPFMTGLARTETRPRALPPSSVIWLRAKLLGTTTAMDRVSRPLNVMQMIAYIVVGGCWAWFLMAKWPDLLHFVLTFTPQHVAEGIAGGSAISLTLVTSVVLLGSVTCMLALHTILAEE